MALQPSKLKLALSVFQHPYFARLWTFQEIVLAPAAILVSDGIEFAFADLMSWYFHYVSKPMFVSPSPKGGKTQALFGDGLIYDSMGSFENIMHVRHQLFKAEELSQIFDAKSSLNSVPKLNMKLSTLLMLTRQLQTLKAEDRVLSLLGLHHDFAIYLRNITDVEGWLPVPELFLATFRYCVEVEHSLDILSAAGIYNGNKRKGFESWPSWLPDWREAYPLRPLVLDNFKTGSDSSPSRTGEQGLEKKNSSIHQASNVLQQSSEVEEDDFGTFSFKVHGYRLGIVLTKTNSWPGRFFLPEAALQAFISTKNDAIDSHGEAAHGLLASLNSSRVTSSFANKVVAATKDLRSRCEPLRTSAAVEAGDWVCILSGGATLYVLRPLDVASVHELKPTQNPHSQSEAYASASSPGSAQATTSLQKLSIECRFVGECAVAALMDGILAQQISDGTFNLPDIPFRLV